MLPAKRRRPDEHPIASSLPRQVQLKMTDLRKVSSLDVIFRQVEALKKSTDAAEPTAILAVLDQLKSHFISIEILETTGLGRLVFRLVQHVDSAIASAASKLYDTWREDSKLALQRQRKMKRGTVPPSRRKVPGVLANQSGASVGGILTQTPFILQSVDIEREIAEWDETSAKGARLRRLQPSLVPPSSFPGGSGAACS